MTKENYLKLKNELKSLAAQIRPAKTEFNQSQRDYSIMQHGNGSWRTVVEAFVNPKMDKGYYSNLKKQYVEAMNRIESARAQKEMLKFKYRHLHIVYCLARGKTMEQIEPKVHGQGTYWANVPDQKAIDEIKKLYGFDETQEIEENESFVKKLFKKVSA